MLCEKRNELVLRLRLAVDDYHATVRRLQGWRNSGEFEKWFAPVEQARQNCMRARELVDRHAKEHGCRRGPDWIEYGALLCEERRQAFEHYASAVDFYRDTVRGLRKWLATPDFGKHLEIAQKAWQACIWLRGLVSRHAQEHGWNRGRSRASVLNRDIPVDRSSGGGANPEQGNAVAGRRVRKRRQTTRRSGDGRSGRL